MKKLLALLLMAGFVAQVSAKACGEKACEPACTYAKRPVCEKTITKVVRRPAIPHKTCHVDYTCPTDTEVSGYAD